MALNTLRDSNEFILDINQGYKPGLGKYLKCITEVRVRNIRSPSLDVIGLKQNKLYEFHLGRPPGEGRILMLFKRLKNILTDGVGGSIL